MTGHLVGKVVLITGAASGFGLLIARKCAAGGAKVVGVGVDVDADGLVNNAGVMPLAYFADPSRPTSTRCGTG